VLLLALLLALVPALQRGDQDVLWPLAGATAAVTLSLAVLVGLGVLFARHVEASLTRGFARAERRPDVIVLVTGVGLVVAALAGLLGFSLAIGASLAGFAFSRDPRRQAIDRAFGAVFQLFTPFFFIGIGLTLELEAVGLALGTGAVLLVAGVAGKLLGTGLAVARTSGWTAGLLIGVSMVPRAEIALIIMRQGQRLGEAVMPGSLYAGMVFMSLASSVLASLAIPALLRRYPQAARGVR
jgi:Kef-type K+ transport system membrane component KefB